MISRGVVYQFIEQPEVNDDDIADAGDGDVENRIRILLKVSLK